VRSSRKTKPARDQTSINTLPSSRFVRLPQAFSHAVGLYGRLSALEHVCLNTVSHHLWGFHGRSMVAVGMSEFRARAGIKSPEAVRRAVAALSTPSDQMFQWGRGKSQRKQGHGILIVVEDATPTTERMFAIQEEWPRWGWPEGSDLTTATVELAKYAKPLKAKWSAEASECAIALRDLITLHTVGQGADVPPAQDTSRAWCRWCEGMQELLDRNYDTATIVAVIETVPESDYWARRLTGRRADRMFVENFDELLLHARQKRRGRW